jgi:hypothetical protein
VHTGRIPLNEVSAEKITRSLTARSEWFGFAGQTFAISSSAVVDQVSPTGRVLLGGLAVIHLGLTIWSRIGRRGPFTIGPPWGAIWLCGALVMPVIVALLVTPGKYGTSPACVQMCAYPSAPLVIFAFYPWGVSGHQWRRQWVQILTLAGIALEPLLIIYTVNDGTVSSTNWHAVILSAFPNVLAFLGGVEVRRLCRQVTDEQFKILKPEYGERYETFHGPIRSLMRSIEYLLPDDVAAEVNDKFRQLDHMLRSEYFELDTLTENVNVLRSIRHHIDLAEPALKVIRDLPTGADLVPQPVGKLIEDAVSGLLVNVRLHAAEPVTVTYRKEHDVAFLIVSDHGPGFDPSTLDDESTHLNDLRQRARLLGGDLKVDPNRGEGAVLRLYVPTYDPR